MAWSISITPEGWNEIYEACHGCEKHFLLEAINETAIQKGIPGISEDAAKEISHEALANIVFEIIQETDTCDNGGFKYWIDPKGFYKIDLQLRR
ncbi:hypothetical protein [Chitinophaga silvisoli]|uniref:Uncharacterized protein n=1 Tax=Chitinophaga silvisoli TaxID=2291814 RepID=A0A3E1P2L5_9BACT|nr:hypothetical protein [Chitinophaga silvisoli]RFM34412.1 hypothetical protein DXN04_14110 [Chitinophaga silvisoli]